MKRKLTSYLFLTVGIALAFLLGGCQSSVTKPPHSTIHATTTQLHYSLTSRVDEFAYNDLLRGLYYMQVNGMTELHLHLFTPGGSVMAMVAMMDVLTQYHEQGIKITTYANGAVRSAGVPLFLMGEVRIIRPNARLMVHPMGNVPNFKELDKTVFHTYCSWKAAYIKVLVDKTNLTIEEAIDVLTGDTHKGKRWYSPYEALSLGFATIMK